MFFYGDYYIHFSQNAMSMIIYFRQEVVYVIWRPQSNSVV